MLLSAVWVITIDMNKYIRPLLLLCFCLAITNCSSAYYGAMEKLGYHKRDILATRVKEARNSQQDAKEQFKTALQRFSEVVKINGGELEKRYNSLNTEFLKSEEKAQKVSDRIDAVEDVGEALFKEWKKELKQYTSDSLRNASEQKYEATQEQFDSLIETMKRAEEKIEPVLAAFRDQVLFLKHNLNARAIASLQTEVVDIQTNVAELIREMDTSINEATRFIDSLEKDA